MGHPPLEVSELTGINHATVRDWVTRAAFWPIALELARKVLESRLDKRLDKLLNLSLSGLEDRLQNGDDIVTKDGDVVKRQVGARDCAIISSILYEKRAALRGQPGNISERRDTQVTLDLIKSHLSKHSQAKLVEVDPETVVADQPKHLNAEKM
jgi:hypothetical protein